MSRRNLFVLVGIVLIAVIGIVIWQSGGLQREKPTAAKIGVLLPFTGSLAAFGESTLSGVELALAEVNTSGGILDGKLELVTADTETNPQAAVLAAQTLVNIGRVSGIVGAMASGVTIPVAQSVASVAGVPIVSPSATSPVLSQLNDKDFLFRTTPHDAVQGILLSKLVSEQGSDIVAVLYRNDDYGRGLAESFAVNYTGQITSIV
jgi:ABC-type branched-subunit amino acid transport system substrate-binding protein